MSNEQTNGAPTERDVQREVHHDADLVARARALGIQANFSSGSGALGREVRGRLGLTGEKSAEFTESADAVWSDAWDADRSVYRRFGRGAHRAVVTFYLDAVERSARPAQGVLL